MSANVGPPTPPAEKRWRWPFSRWCRSGDGSQRRLAAVSAVHRYEAYPDRFVVARIRGWTYSREITMPTNQASMRA